MKNYNEFTLSIQHCLIVLFSIQAPHPLKASGTKLWILFITSCKEFTVFWTEFLSASGLLIFLLSSICWVSRVVFLAFKLLISDSTALFSAFLLSKFKFSLFRALFIPSNSFCNCPYSTFFLDIRSSNVENWPLIEFESWTLKFNLSKVSNSFNLAIPLLI